MCVTMLQLHNCFKRLYINWLYVYINLLIQITLFVDVELYGTNKHKKQCCNNIIELYSIVFMLFG